jgi:release factor glutamine methyltransferase
MERSGAGPPPGIYPAREDTWLLASVSAAGPARQVLEIGAGSGEASLAAARSGARVVATDRNPVALRWLRARATAERLAIDVVRTDLARGLGRFDLVLANPPYLPTPPEVDRLGLGDRLALDGGPDGTSMLARIVDELPDHLRPGAAAHLIVSTVQEATALERIRAKWTATGGRIDRIASRDLEGERLEVWRLTVRR